MFGYKLVKNNDILLVIEEAKRSALFELDYLEKENKFLKNKLQEINNEKIIKVYVPIQTNLEKVKINDDNDGNGFIRCDLNNPETELDNPSSNGKKFWKKVDIF